MQILLCAATQFEIDPLMPFLEEHGFANQVEVLITGVGLLATTYQLTKRVTGKKPDLLLQAGLAGCIDTNIPLGTTAVVFRENVGDFGVLQNADFTSAFDMGLVKENENPWQEKKLVNPHMELLKNTDLPLIDSVTVNEITTNADRISYYKNGLEAGIESMEGAALHYIGLMENIPFLQIRSLSNYIGERDKSKWVLDHAVNILNLELQRQLLKLLSS
ncbi:MAG: futalosine hydrolase [Flavisolibacter sp.]|nr:futalosine hydrolase [Flavisolibacter sp.]